MAGLVEKFKEMWSPSDEYEDYEEQEEFEHDNDSSYEYKSKKNIGKALEEVAQDLITVEEN